MSDFNSSLPIRTEAAGDVEIKIVDGVITTRKLTVNADGSINTIISATDLDIRDLQFATDKVDVSGSEVSLDAATLAALENVTVSATDLDIRDLSHTQDSVKIGDGTDFLAINADGSSNVNIRDASGSAFSQLNPLPVSISANLAGDEVNDFNTAANVAANASSNHDYTVSAGKTLLLSQVEASASGKCKIEIQVETGVATNTFLTKFVMFNSTSNPNMSLKLAPVISVAAGVRVRVVRTNKDNQAQDLYSTISGQEV